jgi:DivIVA domain-containing protein
MLDPRDIDNKQFTTTRLKEGYDQKEVDDFLDRVAEEYKKLQQELAKALSENDVLRRRPAEAPTMQMPIAQTPSALAEKLLAAAEEAGRQHEAEAKAEADRVIREAGGQGARIVEEAQEAAERIKSEGLAEKYRRNEELDRKRQDLERTVSDMTARGQQIKSAFAEALSKLEGKV